MKINTVKISFLGHVIRLNMKLFFYLSLILTNVSCGDFLLSESNSVFTEDKAFSNLDFATKSVNSIYEVLTNYNGYTNDLICTKFDSDIEYSYSPDDASIMSIAHYSANDGNPKTLAIWNNLYSGIERANICIDNLPKSSIWSGEYSTEAHQLYGEAVTLRAFLYYQLITLFGDVPFKVKSTQAGDSFNLPKTDRDSIYSFLLADLKTVENYIPWMTDTKTSVRVSRGFTKGLRARIALASGGYSLRNKTFETRRGTHWQNDYLIANQECLEIIESAKHQLNPNFENIFRQLHTYTQDMSYKEILFEVGMGRLYSSRLGATFGMPFYANDKKYGKGGTQLYGTTPAYYYSFDRSDSRRNVSVELYNYNDANNVSKQRLVSDALRFSLCKWRKSWIVPLLGGDQYNIILTGIDFPIMRYSDILLMFAETENEINNGPTSAAKDALSQVRKRAFSATQWSTKVYNYVDSVSQSKEYFFNAIVDERAWEFGGGELLRKDDLIRWNLLGEKLNQMKSEIADIMYSDYPNPKFANVPSYIFWKYKSDNETIEILNPDYWLPDTPIDGYTKTSWLPLTSEAKRTSVLNTISLVAKGYDSSKNNHLLPININVINASNGALTNDQIP